ncbi:hypothetical protein [Yonghaparkia sp. Root332]|uniref:hypothetical protein n=1 Tax=Yonghaparkia sp. Root332 TaxID=1736516 RepID=UPI0012E36D39|nr:hypothetical protein [Yonghaparkia sp. Root332]
MAVARSAVVRWLVPVVLMVALRVLLLVLVVALRVLVLVLVVALRVLLMRCGSPGRRASPDVVHGRL